MANKQFVVVLRGAPASGKSTIAKELRNFKRKIVWLKVDNFKPFFTEESSLAEQRYVDECSLATLKYLLDKKFSVIIEKIFFYPGIIDRYIQTARDKDICIKVFQIKCSLKTLQLRDKERPGIKEGCRKPLGDEVINKLYSQLENTYYKGAIPLDTEKDSIAQCIRTIKKEVGIKKSYSSYKS